MDASFVPVLSALAGTAVGGITSFATSFFNIVVQTRNERRAREISARQELYAKFLEEMARLYSRAIHETSVNHDGLVSIFALRGRILLISSTSVVEAADEAIRLLVDMMLAPNKTDAELREAMHAGIADPMITFARICRAELQSVH